MNLKPNVEYAFYSAKYDMIIIMRLMGYAAFGDIWSLNRGKIDCRMVCFIPKFYEVFQLLGEI